MSYCQEGEVAAEVFVSLKMEGNITTIDSNDNNPTARLKAGLTGVADVPASLMASPMASLTGGVVEASSC